MRALVVVLSLLLTIAPAAAQGGPNFGAPPKDPKKDPAREKQEDEAYKSSLKRIQAKDAPSSDPWGAVRSDNTPAQNKLKTPANTAR